jgi:HD-like signal output (HDOD) protein
MAAPTVRFTAPTASAATGNPLVIIAANLEPVPYILDLVSQLKKRNTLLAEETQIKYVICTDAEDLTVAVRNHPDSIRLILIGPTLRGRPAPVARMLAKKAQVVLVLDEKLALLGNDECSRAESRAQLEGLGVITARASEVSRDFYHPILESSLGIVVEERSFADCTPEQRSARIDRLLDGVQRFPSLPDTQLRVAELRDEDGPKRWAEAIEPDPVVTRVILRSVNSAGYGFRSRVGSIDKAVALVGVKTVRGLVLACQVRRLFSGASQVRVDDFWRHSIATAIANRLLSLPADPAAQDPHQRGEFERLALPEPALELLRQLGLWRSLPLAGPGDEPFTAGLLHDIGKIALALCLEESLEYIERIVKAEIQEHEASGSFWARPIAEIERLLMKDFDHLVIGDRVAERWELDELPRLLVREHHGVTADAPAPLVRLALADVLANAVFAFPCRAQEHPFARLAARSAPLLGHGATPSREERQSLFVAWSEGFERLGLGDLFGGKLSPWSLAQLCVQLGPAIREATNGFLRDTGSSAGS